MPLREGRLGRVDEEILGEHRDLMLGVAYRVLGRVVDAEDVVQECWLRWAKVDPAQVEDLGAFLLTVVTRLSVDPLRRVRARRNPSATPSVRIRRPAVNLSVKPAARSGVSSPCVWFSGLSREGVAGCREIFSFRHSREVPRRITTCFEVGDTFGRGGPRRPRVHAN